jgi:hypothetical protein
MIASVHGRHRVPVRGDTRHAEVEEASVVGRGREAVREGCLPHLRHQRLRAAAERQEPVRAADDARRGVAAPELELVHHAG